MRLQQTSLVCVCVSQTDISLLYVCATRLTLIFPGKSIPSGYRQVNYPALTGFYLGFLFTIPLCIEWYYVVVSIPTFELSPRLATWFVVRLPILIAAGSLGSMLYCFAQACIILAAYFHAHGTSKSSWYMGAMLTAFALNLAHFIVWVTDYQKHGHLLSFEPYMRENMPGSPVVSTGATTLFLPLMTWFLLIEPITWCFITVVRGAFIAVEAGGVKRFESGGKLSTFGTKYVLVKTNTG